MIFLKNELTPYYEGIINDFRSARRKFGEMCVFSFLVGKNFVNSKYKILFVGKAVNGWEDEVPLSKEDVDVFIEKVLSKNLEGEPMEWVQCPADKKEYNPNRSAFWRIIKETTLALEEKESWYSYIAWTNLYKFAPSEGNPSQTQMDIQAKNCWKILDKEIEILNPRVIIFLTSGWENLYFRNRNLEWNETSFGCYSVRYSKDDKRVIIRTVHPQGKPEQEHVNLLKELVLDQLTVEESAI